MPTMFSNFTPRHIAPLLLATQLCIGGLYPFLYTPSAALLKFGFTPQIAASKAAWPVIKTGSARVTAMGIALWGMYLGGHFPPQERRIPRVYFHAPCTRHFNIVRAEKPPSRHPAAM
ncbi:hypothetical protein SNOG_02766 [Parastagonospora nodorum SN15]|uniref:Uncharacterized protein n=1 Tax=Phaeosphaeria nodorum (strain SN15 / ATCC MYA-4574 / FGSC 10173) TaxID=321614 RepID=Q0UZP8_PHANO|nr:hypothetical protein SNOG_02766 [Parastagonospora nodorum SN15]EAT89497.1 hypothetical protein SNOG_02766 [Parastagonospora nodorum SN15]